MEKRVNIARIARMHGIDPETIYYRMNVRCMTLGEALALGEAQHQGLRSHRYRFAYPILRGYILENHLSVKGFAEKCGVSPHTMHDMLFGRATPTKTTIDKVLEATGMTYEDAFSEEG